MARYIAIIADGNGRWARKQGLPVNAGHDAAADTLKARLRDAAELGVRELTVYAFSTENWSRPSAEVQGLMEMFCRRISIEAGELHQEGVGIRFIGRREGVPEGLARRMEWAESLTKANRAVTLFIALNYGGRAEIIDAARRLQARRVAQLTGGRLEDGAAGRGSAGRDPLLRCCEPLSRSQEDEEFRRCLYAPDMHDPELIIRTGAERRLSNFLLWQAAYSELVFRDELWPEFSRAALEQCLQEFKDRQRRFGGR